MADPNGVSIGNFKGVMLSNRPIGHSVSATESQSTSGVQHQPFKVGKQVEVVHPSGYNPTLKDREQRKIGAKKPQGESYLAKNKKFIKEMEKKREELKGEYFQRIQEEEDAKKKFADQQQKMRDRIRGISSTGESKEDESNEHFEEQEDHYESKEDYADESKHAQNEEEDATFDETMKDELKQMKKRRKQLKSKKGWALSEEEHKELEKLNEEIDDMEILEWANNEDGEFDFDGLSEAAERVLAREEAEAEAEAAAQRALEEEEEEFDEDLTEEEREKLRSKKKAKLTKEFLSRHNKNNFDDRESKDDDTRSIAASVASVASIASMRSIHSKKSLAALAKQVKSENKRKPLDAIPEEDEFQPPRVATIDEENGQRLKNKLLPSNLPYINRNPAL